MIYLDIFYSINSFNFKLNILFNIVCFDFTKITVCISVFKRHVKKTKNNRGIERK